MSSTDATITLLVLAAVQANLYFVLYLFRPWRSTAAGRALMLKTLGNVLVLNMFAAGLLWPEYPGRPWVRVAGLFVFNAGLFYLTVVLVRTPRLGSARERARSGTMGP